MVPPKRLKVIIDSTTRFRARVNGFRFWGLGITGCSAQFGV